jgi:hypothetical protein
MGGLDRATEAIPLQPRRRQRVGRMSAWWQRIGAETRRKHPRGDDPPHRSRYADPPDPTPPKILVDQGRGVIVGYELADGTIVKAMPCCTDPLSCQREECWGPWPRRPWRMGP